MGFLDNFLVAELPPKRCFSKLNFTLQVPQTHKIILLPFLGCDQQNLEKILSDFK